MTYSLYNTGASTAAAQAVLLKENVADLISNLFPLDYPLTQTLEQVPLGGSPWKELPVDTFGQITRTAASVAMSTTTARTDTAVKIEGATPSSLTDEYGHKIRCVSEIHSLKFSATGTAQAAALYGIRDPLAYNAFKATETLMSDFEMRFWHARGTTPSGGYIEDFAAGTATGNGIGNSGSEFPRQTQGLVNWIVRSGLERTVSGTGSTFYNAHGEVLKNSTVDFRAYAYDLNGQNLTRDHLRARLMSPWWAIGGRPDGCLIFCGTKVKQLFTDFANSVNGPINQRNIPASDKAIYDTVDVYVTDVGTHYVNLCRYLDLAQNSVYNTTSAGSDITAAWDEMLIAIMPDYWKIGTYRGVGMTPLAKTNDSDEAMIVGEMGLMCRNPLAGAALINAVA